MKKRNYKILINNEDTSVVFHYAWIPIIVNTWRPRGSKALIWLQKYQTQNGKKFCTRLGFFSHEFN